MVKIYANSDQISKHRQRHDVLMDLRSYQLVAWTASATSAPEHILIKLPPGEACIIRFFITIEQSVPDDSAAIRTN